MAKRNKRDPSEPKSDLDPRQMNQANKDGPGKDERNDAKPEKNAGPSGHGQDASGTDQVDSEIHETVRADDDLASDQLSDTSDDVLDDFPEPESSTSPSMIGGDSHATSIPEEPVESGGDLDATIANSTVPLDPQDSKQKAGQNPPPSPDRPRQETPRDVAANHITDGEIDQTIAVNLPPSGKRQSTVRRGSISDASAEKDVTARTTVRYGERDKSILASSEIGQTVNPRELSAPDAEAWNRVVGGGTEPSVLPPAIDRTFSDKHFERLRKCDIAPLKSDVNESSDYRLIRKLGAGGMGDVYTARQGSLDRLLALKLIKPLSGNRRQRLLRAGKLKAVEEDRRQQFLSEAIVTGDLDHPNIVPIHDVALTSNNELFYSMKRVVGTPWSDVIKEKSRDENLEILLKAADAVAFAHTRGVIHRDLKPENIMLGDFGVVMVMDWGLALPTSQYEKHESVFATSGLGGTPAFMAPEMATGPVEQIGPAADIYLLGATLYMIITGRAPHQAKNVSECLEAVRSNKIRPVPQEQQGELLDIALKAMADKPEDRFSNVESFQQAIRDYRSHSESISLATRATDDLEIGQQNRSHSDFSRAAFRFEEAIRLWPGNSKARQGLSDTKFAHAQAALEEEDFKLGLSLLDHDNPKHQPLVNELRRKMRERNLRDSTLAWLRRAAVAMLLFIIVGGAAAIWQINQARMIANEERLATLAAKKVVDETNEKLAKAVDDEKAARNDELVAKYLLVWKNSKLDDANEELDETNSRLSEALQTEKEARKAETKALEAEKLAVQAEKAAKQRAEYESYVSRIGLAKARLERNEVDLARNILEELREEFPRVANLWEWRWLWQQTQQGKPSFDTEDAVIDQAFGTTDDGGLVALRNGRIQWVAFDEREPFFPRLPERVVATVVAINAQDQLAAVGTESGDIYLLSNTHTLPNGSAETFGPLRGHTQRVTDVKFSDDGLLVSASSDKTVRVWDPRSRSELTAQEACWHISPVRQIAVAGSASGLTVVAAISEEQSGQVAVWKLSRGGQTMNVARLGTFNQHSYPVWSVALSPDGKRVASGDTDGNLLTWDLAQAEPIDYNRSIQEALEKLKDSPASLSRNSTSNSQPVATAVRLVDDESQQRLVSTSPAADDLLRAHDDVINSIRFSANGKSLVTASDDYTLKVWDVESESLRQTLKGHGGRVVGADFLPGRDDVIVSSSDDATVRQWKPSEYLGAFVVHQLSATEPASPNRRIDDEHEGDVWSASFSGDGKKVVTASHDHTARILEINEETLAFSEVTSLQDEVLDEGSSFIALSMHVRSDADRLYIGSADATIRIWDLSHGTQIDELTGTGLNTSFAVSHDGRSLLTGSSSPEIVAKFWILDANEHWKWRDLRANGSQRKEAVTAFAISGSGDEQLLFTGDRLGRGTFWNAANGQKTGPQIDLGFRINAASFTSDGRHLLVGSDARQLIVVDVANREIDKRLLENKHLLHDGYVTQLSVSPRSDDHVLTVSESVTPTSVRTTVTLWNWRSGEGQIIDEFISGHGSSDVSDRTVQPRITSARFDASGRLAVVSRSVAGNLPATVRIWKLDDLDAGSTLRTLTAKDSQTERTFTARFQPSAKTYQLPPYLGTAQVAVPLDEQVLLTMNRNGAFKWDLGSNELIKSYRAHGELTEACFSADGKHVATGSRSVKIWDANSGKALAKLESKHPIRSVQFAPQTLGPELYLFATGGDDGIAKLWKWDSANREIIPHLELDKRAGANEDRPRINRVRFSPDGSQLLVVGDRGLAQIWDLQTAQLIRSFSVDQRHDLKCGDFSEDGSFVAVGGTEKHVILWKSADEAFRPIYLSGHAETVNDVTFLVMPDEEPPSQAREERSDHSGTLEGGQNPYANLRLMTASDDDTAKVWDPRIGIEGQQRNEDQENQLELMPRVGRELISLERHVGPVTSVDVNGSGTLLMTAGVDGTVILWPANPPAANGVAPR